MTSVSREAFRMTGFDLEVECQNCETSQTVSDDGSLGQAEVVELFASEGAYRLAYSLLCWNCGVWMRGGFTIRSRRLSKPAKAGVRGGLAP